MCTNKYISPVLCLRMLPRQDLTSKACKKLEQFFITFAVQVIYSSWFQKLLPVSTSGTRTGVLFLRISDFIFLPTAHFPLSPHHFHLLCYFLLSSPPNSVLKSNFYLLIADVATRYIQDEKKTQQKPKHCKLCFEY